MNDKIQEIIERAGHDCYNPPFGALLKQPVSEYYSAIIRRAVAEVLKESGAGEALRDLLFVHENADETGYVDGVGFYRGFDEIPYRCQSALSKLEPFMREGEGRR